LDLSVAQLFGYLFDGLAATLTWHTLAALAAGVFIGFWVGVLPGIGGPATLALLIPLTFSMDPFSAFALLLGMISVTSAAGDMTAILFGIPGESSNAAITLDGARMAKRGEAGRALGAVLVASLIGSIIGAACLALGIMIVRPLVLSVGYVELLMLSLTGIAFIASLSANSVFKGMVAGALGLLLSSVGLSQVTGVERYTFDSLLLWDGVGLVPALLGLFAIPELVEMALQRKHQPGAQGRIKGASAGVRDAFRHIGIVSRCSIISTYIGILPGMGATIAQWVAYAHASQSVRPKEMVGKGAIECVVGPGAATAATASGSLVPTIAFGIPGSPQMAILLGAFLLHGLVPGPSMLIPEAQGGHLTLTLSMVWMIVLSNVIIVAGLFLILNQLAKVSYLDAHLLVPFVVALVFIGGFSDKNELTDLVVCIGFGIVGWIMVELDWPRPPLILGMVLGALVENNLFLTVQAYGTSWWKFPSVIVMTLLIIASTLWPYAKTWLAARRSRTRAATIAIDSTLDSDIGTLPAGAPPRSPLQRGAIIGDLCFEAVTALLLIAALIEASRWSYAAKLMPMVVCIAGLGFLALQIGASCRQLSQSSAVVAENRAFGLGEKQNAGLFTLWICLVYLGLIFLLGFAFATATFVLGYLVRRSPLRWPAALALAVAAYVAVDLGFGRALGVPFPAGWLREYAWPWMGLAR
jgi:putative tricarboxylic transport membrane protein